MSLAPRSVAEVLASHVTLEVESIDRMYLNLYVPRLQVVGGAVSFFLQHRGETLVTMKLMSKMTMAFREAVDQLALRYDIPVVRFERGQRKDDVMHEHLKRFPGKEGVLFIGIAQEKAKVMRTIRKRARNGKDYPWVVKSSAMVNHYYFYCLDRDFGPFFLKFCSYFPYSAKLNLNGHEWVKRQLEARGIRYTALDNGILNCSDPDALQQLCDQFGERDIRQLTRKWLRRLPNPFSDADQAAGYQYDLSILQVELSRTQIFDRPVHGRIFFEQVIRENLDLGRPENVQLIFERRIARNNPTRFRTRVITEGVIPSIHVYYKSTHLKQYFKEGRGLRTETTINNTYDFNIGRSLTNLPALCSIGFQANRRLLDVQTVSHDCMIGQEKFEQLARPLLVQDRRVPALPFHDVRVQALLSVLVQFSVQVAGFRSQHLQECLAPLLGLDPAQYSTGRRTYDLRRLRLRGFIERIQGTHRYRVTNEGLRVAMLYSRLYGRVFRPGLTALAPAADTPISKTFRTLFSQLDDLVTQARLAA